MSWNKNLKYFVINTSSPADNPVVVPFEDEDAAKRAAVRMTNETKKDHYVAKSIAYATMTGAQIYGVPS